MQAAYSERHLKAGGYKKPISKFDAWLCPFAADKANLIDMEFGSRALLKRLWDVHPHILQHQADCGRRVARP